MFGAALLLLAAAPLRASDLAEDAIAAIRSRTAEMRAQAAPARARSLSYRIAATRRHDPKAFTEGLLWHKGYLYESTGLHKHSTLRKIDPATGEVAASVALPPEAFGEGLALAGDRLVQLTWTGHKALVYDLDTLKRIDEYRYDGEGWGLTYDGTDMIMSDGSDVLTFRDPMTFAPRRRLQVVWDGKPVTNINELEFINGSIWANIWHDDRIILIDPASGKVTAFLDMSRLAAPNLASDSEAVLNGIAYDAGTGRVFIGGKDWPFFYEIAVDSE